MPIRYTTSLQHIDTAHLSGFFEGWGNPPSPATHLTLLRNSAAVVLAIDDDSGQVVGFINALSDGVLCAFIPLLEVLPAYRGHGIGTALVQQMQAQLSHLYSIDLICDVALQPFYQKLGMQPYSAMVSRHYVNQAGYTQEKPAHE